MGVELKLTPTSFRRRVILRALVIVFAFSVVSIIRNLNGAYQGETHLHHRPRKVDDCAVNFAFLGPFLFSGNGFLSRSDSNGLVRSVSPVSSLLKNSSVVHVASLGEQVLIVFRRHGEDSFGLDQSHHHHLPGDCSSVLNSRPYIGLLEPLLEEKRSDFERRIHYLPEFIDVSSRKRLVYIDIGAADHLTPRSDWFFPSYPIDKKAFNSYFVHHNTSILTSYVKSPGVTFIYHPGLAGTVASRGEEEEEPFVEDDSFDFLAWFKETASFADFLVLKMNTSEAELKFLSELIKTGAICSVDELFLHCNGYGDCNNVIKSLRSSGVFVHQWWED
uniref:DUF7870 domain-containing protein n=1 Tax=Brassica campestris TaxID=3711 RepID=M4FFA9_BRACM